MERQFSELSYRVGVWVLTIVIVSLLRLPAIASGYTFALHPELPRCRGNVSHAQSGLSYESVREWCLKFGQTYANKHRKGSFASRQFLPLATNENNRICALLQIQLQHLITLEKRAPQNLRPPSRVASIGFIKD
jgi:hypothetical protein